MGRIVIVAYKPKPGRSAEVRSLCAQHVPALRAEGLVTSRPPIVAEAADGTVIEVFEWASEDAIARAHGNPAVQDLWARYAEVCDYVPIGAVPEAAQLFSEFEPLK
jgi:quinol monooxygenase YgiN